MKTTLYKLVDKDWTTHGGCRWALGVKNVVRIKGNTLCTAEVLHAYTDPLVAAFLNPTHANFKDPILLRCESECVVAYDRGLKVGCKDLTPVEILEMQMPTSKQIGAFGIYCVLCYKSDRPSMVEWAERGLRALSIRDSCAYPDYGWAASEVVSAADCIGPEFDMMLISCAYAAMMIE